MTIEARDRKILWARSHNSCAICKQPLVVDATETDRESVVGDEAHIVAQSSGGPRASLIPTADLNKYENLILLCKVHHKQIDDQPGSYTAERLRQLKAEHERWAHEKFDNPAAEGGGSVTETNALEVFPYVPRTQSEIDYVICNRPWSWEFLLYAGHLQIGLEEIRSRKTVSRLYPLTSIENGRGSSAYAVASLRDLKAMVNGLELAFEVKDQVEAFGREGMSGDFRLIHGMARRVLSVYKQFLEWSQNARNVTGPRNIRRLLTSVSKLADRPIHDIETWVIQLVTEVERVLHNPAAGTGKNFVITATCKVTLDEDLLDDIFKEQSRIYGIT
ncbi:HNH endonuclease [Nocardia sp. NPDC050175]|uniref:HNH endonuclease n=1 Tax=Nocardia sp. NPDC050175 TaxID=3364317 RepID=UPI00379D5D0C